jgi:hypothetical protein
MARKALAWLTVLGLMGPTSAREVSGGERENVEEERFPDDIPDNMEVFRQTPVTGEAPYPRAEEETGTGGAGTAGTGQERRGELHGEVVDVEGNQLLLRHGGVVFPLELTEETRFTPDRQRALQPGQEVRARFTLDDNGYVVNALEPVVPARRAPGQKRGDGQREAPER